MRVLELGCGTGSTAIYHAPVVQQIDATDLSANMLAIARQKAADAGVDNITFRQDSVESLTVPDGTYDAVLALSLLHLLRDREAAIAKIARLLKPGGVFVSEHGVPRGDDQPNQVRVATRPSPWPAATRALIQS